LRTAIGRNRDRLPDARVHRWSVVTDTPNDAAIVRTPLFASPLAPILDGVLLEHR
jgi:hypothetical protein